MKKSIRRSDPIQGILFKTQPVLLTSRAKARAKNRRHLNGIKFFSHLPAISSPVKRLRRYPKLDLPKTTALNGQDKNCSLFGDED